MNDEDVVQTQDPVIEVPPGSDPVPDPAAPPVEVIPVDEFLERLAELLAEQDAAPEDVEVLPEAEDPAITIDGDVDIDLPAADPATAIVEHLLDMIIDLGKIEGHLSEIEKDTGEIQLDVMTIAQAVDHPALTTSFADYTVTEALLLFLLLAAFLSACARMLRGGFSWLRS